MKIIKEFTHVLVFDKNNKYSHCINKPDEIETILTNSPVVAVNDESKIIGYITRVQNRSKTGNYYGDIILNDDYDKITIVKSIVTPVETNSYKIKIIVTCIERK